MSIDLNGKRALVTGSTSGMGYAIARRLTEAGAQVYLHGRSEGSVRSAVDRLRLEYPSADIRGHAVDLANPNQVIEITAEVPDIDILVSNTGPTPSTSVLEMALGDPRAVKELAPSRGSSFGEDIGDRAAFRP
ncbi:MAG: SDR family NAD(P)-dependent oxidoreductase [Chloroflexota bacterium]